MLKIIQKIALLLWRVWFYVLAAIPIITLFPILLLIASHKNGYPTLYWIARNVWSPFILIGMGFYIRTKFAKPLPEGTSYLLVANHSSYLDPFVMFRVSKNPFVFVGKKEFIKVPLFGSIYKRAWNILIAFLRAFLSKPTILVLIILEYLLYHLHQNSSGVQTRLPIKFA